MTQQKSAKEKSPKIVICDSNVIIMMTIFKPSIMFSAKYSHGELAVHQLVIDEIERWLQPESRKFKKFGKGLIQDALGYCTQLQVSFAEPAESERKKSHGIMSAIESHFKDDEKGAPTSKTDKDLLLLAKKSGAMLATQERTLRSLGRKVIGLEKMLLFEDLVVDVFIQKLMSKEEILHELDTLNKMGESLSAEGKEKLMASLK